jgi:uncharacterized integral membrane protein (TIGR00698 family)
MLASFLGRELVPAIVIALVIGIAFSRLAARPLFEPGLDFSVRTLLQWAIACLGVRVALADLGVLGPLAAVLIACAMLVTIAVAYRLSCSLGTGPGFGMLAGAANAVCGASATLAAATVVPNYPLKSADIAFSVLAANAFSTLVMLLYPQLARLLGLSADETAVLLGATIQDMAQVAAAGFLVSESVGTTAVIVKLFRVLLLLPVTLGIGWWMLVRSVGMTRATVPVPAFALVFLALAVMNSLSASAPIVGAWFILAKPWLAGFASWGLMTAIAALGLRSSLDAINRVRLSHAVVFAAGSATIFVCVLGGIFLMRYG